MTREFDPSIDGWYFENWGETSDYCLGCDRPSGHTGDCEFTWDLYKETYLAINPTHDCLEAPPDCAFYEIFKTCASQGNCGGMSLLALALFKYGGYMGFCSPASFYTGNKSPDRQDLHRAINILQARQFGARGIINFVETFDANNINNAHVAFQKVKEHLAKGDFAVLSIANSPLGESAHTVIPYKVEDNPTGYPSGTKLMHIWDPNHPYDADPSHYSGPEKLMEISGPFNWTYTSGSTTYSGAGGGWCFAVPMSLVLTKARQPIGLDLISEALLTIFVSGPGAAVSQISDNEGRRLYKTDIDCHLSRLEFETDPQLRLKGVARWPWFDSNKQNKSKGELYFVHQRKSKTSPLNVEVTGTNFKIIECLGKNLIEIDSSSKEHARDIIRTQGPISDAISLSIMTTGKERKLSVNHLLAGKTSKDWRRYILRNIKLPEKVPITLIMENKMDSVIIDSQEKGIQFELDIQQRRGGKVVSKRVGKISTIPNKMLKLAPKDWKTLRKSKILKYIRETNQNFKPLIQEEKRAAKDRALEDTHSKK